MGVLDDAIREHLELKRRHGVAEEELRREAEEALGPARREVAPAEAEEDGAAAAPAEAASSEATPVDEPTADHELQELAEHDEAEPSEMLHASEVGSDLHEEERDDEELALDGPTEDHVPVEEAPGLAAEAPARHDTADRGEPRARDDTPARAFEESEDDELLDEEEPADEELLPHEGLAHGDREHDALEDEEVADDDESEGDDRDLLEDTPDFLEETPEHDRLWFEQKPPRDFDFD